MTIQEAEKTDTKSDTAQKAAAPEKPGEKPNPNTQKAPPEAPKAEPPVPMKMPVGIPGAKEGLRTEERFVPLDEPPPLPLNADLKSIGKPTPRLDGKLKVTGAAKYTADVKLPGMLYGVMITSPHASASIKSIDTAAAENYPGVKAVHVLDKVIGAPRESRVRGAAVRG